MHRIHVKPFDCGDAWRVFEQLLQAQPGPWVGPFHWENVLTASGEERARRLRVNEMLRLMSFPDDFKIDGTRSDIQRQLGNAVPLELGKAVVRALMDQLGYLDRRQAVRDAVFVGVEAV